MQQCNRNHSESHQKKKPFNPVRVLLSAVVCTLTLSQTTQSLPSLFGGFVSHASAHETYSVAKKLEVRDKVTELFYHGYRSYMQHAFPKDELKPLSCKGDDTFGGYSLTLIDTLDMLALVGDNVEFMKQVHFVARYTRYQPRVVSVFETTIRVLGGLISAHHLALRVCKEIRASDEWATLSTYQRDLFTYSDGLLLKAVELADLLLPAFNTPTGIPYNEINMRSGTQKSKGHATCPAGAGSLLLEFGALSVLTGNCTYVAVAERALEGVWKHRSGQSLVGTMIDVFSGKWINGESSIGASIDSFYEYMVKSYMYFGEDKFLHMWDEAYKAVQKYTYFGGWYLSSSVELLSPIDHTDHKFNSLQAFWPGLQVLAGDIPNALDSWAKMWCIVDKIGLPPEYVDLASFFAGNPQLKRSLGPGYPLRPEFLESTYFLYKATGEERFLNISEVFVAKLERMKQRCGFAAVVDVYSFTFEDKMDSFVLAETFKYLYLMFTPSETEIATENRLRRAAKRNRLAEIVRDKRSLDNDAWLDKVPSMDGEVLIKTNKLLYDVDLDQYVVNTEAHPLLIDKDSQSIFKKCKSVRSKFLLPLNEPSRVHNDHFRAHHTVDKSLARNAWDEKRMCRPIEYMRDIAPFIDRTFYDKGFCAVLPSTRVLGHSNKVHNPVMSYDAVAKRLSQGGVKMPQFFDMQIPVEVPPDPLATVSKTLKLYVSTRVSVPHGTAKVHAPKAVSHFGITSIPFLRDAESLYLPTNDIFLRAAPSTSGAGSDEYNAADAYIQCTNANFGPKLCDNIVPPLNPNALKIAKTLHVYHAAMPTGCTPAAIGDTSLYRQPFAVAIHRGGCTFKEKALSAQIKGAAMVIIVNADDQLIHMGDSEVSGAEFQGVALTIPLAMMSGDDARHVLPPTKSAASVLEGAQPDASDFTLLNVICARSAVEQYKLLGISLLVRASDVLIYRHRMSPLVDAFVAKTSPEALRSHYTDPSVACAHCALIIKQGSVKEPVDASNYSPSIGLYGGSFVNSERRLQFALSPKPPAPSRFPLVADPQTRSSTGVAYFFGAHDSLFVAEIRRFKITDVPAFNFYNNRLGSWLEKKGMEIGVGSSFTSVVSKETNEAVEVTLFTTVEAQQQFGQTDFINKPFMQANVLRTMRDLFISDLHTEIFDQGREYFVQPRTK